LDVSHKVVHGEPLCDRRISITLDDFFLLEDGTMYFSETQSRYPADSYCIEERQGYAGQEDTIVMFCESRQLDYGDSCVRFRRAVYPVLEAISCVFLLLTLVVFRLVPEISSKAGGRNLQFHVASLLVAMTVGLAYRLAPELYSFPFCMLIAVVMQFSLLSAFFWLSAMCFENWNKISSSVRHSKRFSVCCLPAGTKEARKARLYAGRRRPARRGCTPGTRWAARWR